MKTKLVLWGHNEKDEKILIALQLRPEDNKVDIWTFSEMVATDEFAKTLMNQWRNDKEVEFPEVSRHLERELSVTESLLPDDIKVDRGDIVQRAQTEWHFVVLSSKLNELYRSELNDLQEKVGQLTAYSSSVWDNLKEFWSKVQGQVRERNLLREHADALRDDTNSLFDRMKTLRSALDDQFQQSSQEHTDKFMSKLETIEKNIADGVRLPAIFDELKKMQKSFREVKLTRDHRSKIWNRLDAAFKAVKEKRFGPNVNSSSSALERLTRRYNGLLGAIDKMKRSIERDQDELAFQKRRIDTTDGQLEAQIRQAKVNMTVERIRSKQEKYDEMLKTKEDLERRIAIQKDKDAKRQQKQEMEAAKLAAKEKIAKKIQAEADARKEEEVRLEKAADAILQPNTLQTTATEKVADAKDAVVETGEAIAEKATEIKDAATEKVADAKDAVVETGEAIAEKATEIKDAATEKVADAKDAVVETGEAIAEKATEIKDAATEKVADAKDAVVETGEAIAEKATKIKDAATEKVADAKDAVVETGEAIAEKATEIKDAATEKVADAKDAVVETGEAIAEKATEIKDAATEKVADAKDAVVETGEAIAEKATEIKDAATEKVADAKDAVAEKTEDVVDDLKDGLKTAAGFVLGAGAAALTSLKDAKDAVVEKATDLKESVEDAIEDTNDASIASSEEENKEDETLLEKASDVMEDVSEGISATFKAGAAAIFGAGAASSSNKKETDTTDQNDAETTIDKVTDVVEDITDAATSTLKNATDVLFGLGSAAAAKITGTEDEDEDNKGVVKDIAAVSEIVDNTKGDKM